MKWIHFGQFVILVCQLSCQVDVRIPRSNSRSTADTPGDGGSNFYLVNDTGTATGVVDGSCSPCTIYEAVQEANNDGSDIVILPGRYNLNATLNITNSYTITGNSQISVILNGENNVQIMEIAASAGSVTIEELTFENGFDATDSGALIINTGNSVILNSVSFQTNQSGGSGGALSLATASSLTANTCHFENNRSGSDGGAMYLTAGHNGVLLNNCRMVLNRATGEGGAIFNGNGSLTLSGASFELNKSETRGGAIYAETGANQFISIENATFFRNIIKGDEGSAIFFESLNATPSIIQNTVLLQNSSSSIGGTDQGALHVSSGSMNLYNNNIMNNYGEVCSGITNSGAGTITLQNNIIAGNYTYDNQLNNCDGTFISSGSNLTDSASGDCNTVQVSDINSQSNFGIQNTTMRGQFYETMATILGAPGIDAGSAAGAPTTDQRGVARSGTIDIGVFEYEAGAVNPPTGISYERSFIALVEDIQSINITPTLTGGAPTSYSISPTLVAGLSFNTINGVISGTPVDSTSETGAEFLITATNAHGSASTRLKIIVLPGFEITSTADTSDADTVGPGLGTCEATIFAGDCTLRAAIEEIAASGGIGAIYLPNNTYTLGSPLALNGLAGSLRTLLISGQSQTAIVDANNVNAFDLDNIAKHVYLSNFTIENYNSDAIKFGTSGEEIQISQMEFSSPVQGSALANTTARSILIEYTDFIGANVGATIGGGLNSNVHEALLRMNAVSVTNFVLTRNAAAFTSGTNLNWFVENSYFAGNNNSISATTFQIQNSAFSIFANNTFYQNTVTGGVGSAAALAVFGNYLVYENNTAIGNEVTGVAGPVIGAWTGTVSVRSSLFEDNLYDTGGTPTAGACFTPGTGVIYFDHYNSYDAAEAGCNTGGSDLNIATSAFAGPGTPNGGPVNYFTLNPASGYINSGSPTTCLSYRWDISQAVRVEVRCDIGAYEFR